MPIYITNFCYRLLVAFLHLYTIYYLLVFLAAIWPFYLQVSDVASVHVTVITYALFSHLFAVPVVLLCCEWHLDRYKIYVCASIVALEMTLGCTTQLLAIKAGRSKITKKILLMCIRI